MCDPLPVSNFERLDDDDNNFEYYKKNISKISDSLEYPIDLHRLQKRIYPYATPDCKFKSYIDKNS